MKFIAAGRRREREKEREKKSEQVSKKASKGIMITIDFTILLEAII